MKKFKYITNILKPLTQVWVPIAMALFTITWGVHQSRQSHQEHQIKVLLDLRHSYDMDFRALRVQTARSLLGNKKNPQYDELMGFFETIGMLTDDDSLDVEQVWQNFGYAFERYFQATKTYMDGERASDNTLWQDAYDLHAELTTIERQQSGKIHAELSFDEIHDFLHSESRLFDQKGGQLR